MNPKTLHAVEQQYCDPYTRDPKLGPCTLTLKLTKLGQHQTASTLSLGFETVQEKSVQMLCSFNLCC